MGTADAVSAEVLEGSSEVGVNLAEAGDAQLPGGHAHGLADLAGSAVAGQEVAVGMHVDTETAAAGDTVSADNSDWGAVTEENDLLYFGFLVEQVMSPSAVVAPNNGVVNHYDSFSAQWKWWK